MSEIANPNITPAGIEVRIGQIWRDLDVRSNIEAPNGQTRPRQVIVIAVHAGRATVRGTVSARVTRIAVKNLRPNTKGDRGYTLVSEPEEKK